MSNFSVRFQVRNLAGTRSQDVEAMVDTGSVFTTLPGDLLDRLGVSRARRERFQVATGAVVENDVGDAIVRIDGKESVSPVIFGGPGEPALLGAVTLETLLLGVDPHNERLIPIVGIRYTRLPAV